MTNRVFGTVLLLVCATALLPGCFTSSSPPKELKAGRGDESGLVFGTIGTGGADETITERRILYRLVGADLSDPFNRDHRGGFGHVNSAAGLQAVTRLFFRIPTDVSEGAVKATLFRQRLLPGDYEIYGEVYTASMAYGFAIQIFMRDIEPIAFRVEANRATYLGQFLSYRVKIRDQDGVPVFGGGYFEISDRLARDLALLNGRNDEILVEDTVINASLNGSTIDRAVTRLPVFE
jgi:hypothetical protein